MIPESDVAKRLLELAWIRIDLGQSITNLNSAINRVSRNPDIRKKMVAVEATLKDLVEDIKEELHRVGHTGLNDSG